VPPVRGSGCGALEVCGGSLRGGVTGLGGGGTSYPYPSAVVVAIGQVPPDPLWLDRLCVYPPPGASANPRRWLLIPDRTNSLTRFPPPQVSSRQILGLALNWTPDKPSVGRGGVDLKKYSACTMIVAITTACPLRRQVPQLHMGGYLFGGPGIVAC